MAVGSGGTDVIRMIKRQQRAAHQRQQERREARDDRRKNRTESDEDEQYTVIPSDVWIRREERNSRHNIGLMALAAGSFQIFELACLLFETARLHLGPLSIAGSTSLTFFFGLMLSGFLLAMIREHPRRFPEIYWALQRPLWVMAWLGVVVHLALGPVALLGHVVSA